MPQVSKILKGLDTRIGFLIALSFIVIALLLARLGQLQLSHDKEYIERIRQQSMRPIRIPPVRGRIESSDGQILVDNKVSYDLVFFLPEFRLRGSGGISRTAEYMKEVLTTIAGLLELENKISTDGIANKLKDKSQEKVTLVPELSDQQLQILDKRILPAFIIVAESRLILDYSKVELLEGMGSIARTTKNICQEIDRICILIGRPLQDNEKKVRTHIFQKPALPFIALENLDKRELSLISEMIPPINGTSIVANTKRYYPFPYEYSHILGHTRLKDPSEEDREERKHFHYFLPSLYGVNGMERYMEEELKGTAGTKVVQVNISGYVQEYESGRHSVLKQEDLKKYNYEPTNGNNVILTLDHEAQKLAYYLLNKIDNENLQIPLKAGETTRAAFVLMDCQTGAIKAMVSTPSFDMHRFTNRDPEYFNELYGETYTETDAQGVERKKRRHPEGKIPDQLRQQPLINRALSTYEPGSIIKPLLALAALRDPSFNPNEIFECNGFHELPNGKKIRCAARYGHGDIDLYGAIEQSCNPYFIALGLKLGIKTVNEIYQAAGVGRFPLNPDSKKKFTQEKKGILPGQGKWYLADTAYASIGQGRFTLSPLQAAVFVSAIANGGKVLKPFWVKEVRDSRNEKVLSSTSFPQIVDRLPVDEDILSKVKEGMRRVVAGENAGAGAAEVKYEGSLELAGKTGTAEVSYVERDKDGEVMRDAEGKAVIKKAKNTWFTCYAPYDKPKYVAVCFVQGGIYGGTTCAPLVRKFFDKWSKTKPKKME